MAKQKPKRYYTRTIDLLFLLVFLIVGIVSFTIAFTFGILPVKWTMAGSRRYSADSVPYIIYAVHEEASQVGCDRQASVYPSFDGGYRYRGIFSG